MDEKPILPLAAVNALREGRKVEAIKLAREELGVDLKEAKQRVERYLRADPLVQASYAQMRTRSGPGAWWIVAIAAGAALGYLWWSAS